MSSSYDIDKIQAEQNEAALDHYIRGFIKRFEPEDRSDRLDFERDLHHIVRMIYAEAQRPLMATIADATMRMPVMPFQTNTMGVAKKD